MAGIRLHEGKTRGVEQSWRVSRGDCGVGSTSLESRGRQDLGHASRARGVCGQAVVAERLVEEQKLWDALPWVPDVQCAWEVLVQCAGPRCHDFLRTLPPSQTGEYPDGHGLGMMQAMESLLGGLTGEVSHRLWAHHLASLPMRLGGLGLRSARRMSQAAYWASWADALHVIEQRLPRAAENIVTPLEDRHLEGCLGELQDAARSLDLQGFVTRPSLAEFSRGKRPPFADSSEPGEWQHGWQFYASEQFFRETVVFAQSWSGQRMNGRWRCWRQGSPSTRERSWTTTDGAVLVRARADKEAKNTELPRKPMSFGGGGPGDRGQMEHRGNHFCRSVGGRSRRVRVPHVLRRSTHQATWRGTEGARLESPRFVRPSCDRWVQRACSGRP